MIEHFTYPWAHLPGKLIDDTIMSRYITLKPNFDLNIQLHCYFYKILIVLIDYYELQKSMFLFFRTKKYIFFSLIIILLIRKLTESYATYTWNCIEWGANKHRSYSKTVDPSIHNGSMMQFTECPTCTRHSIIC